MSTNRQKKISDNYHRILERIDSTAVSAGRNPEDVRLVVVTKTQPIDVIYDVVEAGAIDLGENYVEEATPKIQSLGMDKNIRWHMIGHVQSRKAQYVCEYFQYVHSVDSIKLAKRLNKFSQTLKKTLPIWIELNVSGEDSKYGWHIETQDDLDHILPVIKQISSLPKLKLLGLMTIPPYSEEPEASRIYYQRLYKFQKYIADRLQLVGFTQLSMGMSSDFEIAIQEGSTCVRIGQAILGPRPS
jgi:pyridoxal phosphate enzyme (YggS family)